MNWNAFYQPSIFIIFSIKSFAEAKIELLWLAEIAEVNWLSEYHTEYLDENGIYLFAEYANMFISSTILVFLRIYHPQKMSWVEN
jgi:NADH-quinone oxidoreductase subunit H